MSSAEWEMPSPTDACESGFAGRPRRLSLPGSRPHSKAAPDSRWPRGASIIKDSQETLPEGASSRATQALIA